MTFVISKTHVVAQQPYRTQPNTKFVVAKVQLFTINNDKKTFKYSPEAASPVRLVRPRPDHFSAGRWSHFQTVEIV